MNKNQTKEQELIDVEELPVYPYLQPIRVFDGLYPEDEEERQAYWDFIEWTMTRKHAVLLSVPQQKNESDIWQIELDEFGNDSSAFNTMDYQKLHPTSPYVLCHMNPKSKHYGKQYIARWKLLKGLCKDAGVEAFGYHDIRHTVDKYLNDLQKVGL